MILHAFVHIGEPVITFKVSTMDKIHEALPKPPAPSTAQLKCSCPVYTVKPLITDSPKGRQPQRTNPMPPIAFFYTYGTSEKQTPPYSGQRTATVLPI